MRRSEATSYVNIQFVIQSLLVALTKKIASHPSELRKRSKVNELQAKVRPKLKIEASKDALEAGRAVRSAQARAKDAEGGTYLFGFSLHDLPHCAPRGTAYSELP